ncbi:hypothetical protein [Streptomyces sp. NPDC101150]|uniref:hypothetical protein n=1 Tax=Streptomyces sp. NPDC101150 TaxID=3366114 RepID=UPI0037F933FC
MSQSYPPPPGQPQQPQQPQYGAPAPGAFPAPGGYPPPAPAATGNAGLAIVAGIVVMLIVAAIYGAILKATDGATIGYAALALGAAIGAVMGKIGGRNPAVPVIAAVLGLLAYYLGGILAFAFALGDYVHISFFEALFQHYDLLNEGWTKSLEAIDALFFILAAAGGFSTARKLAG